MNYDKLLRLIYLIKESRPKDIKNYSFYDINNLIFAMDYIHWGKYNKILITNEYYLHHFKDCYIIPELKNDLFSRKLTKNDNTNWLESFNYSYNRGFKLSDFDLEYNSIKLYKDDYEFLTEEFKNNDVIDVGKITEVNKLDYNIKIKIKSLFGLYQLYEIENSYSKLPIGDGKYQDTTVLNIVDIDFIKEPLDYNFTDEELDSINTILDIFKNYSLTSYLKEENGKNRRYSYSPISELVNKTALFRDNFYIHDDNNINQYKKYFTIPYIYGFDNYIEYLDIIKFMKGLAISIGND